MADVMIKCPSTGKPVNTGMGMDKAGFESSTLEQNMVECPHCSQAHTWSKKDAYLAD